MGAIYCNNIAATWAIIIIAILLVFRNINYSYSNILQYIPIYCNTIDFFLTLLAPLLSRSLTLKSPFMRTASLLHSPNSLCVYIVDREMESYLRMHSNNLSLPMWDSLDSLESGILTKPKTRHNTTIYNTEW